MAAPEVFDADAAAKAAVAEYPPFQFKWKEELYELPNMALLNTNEAIELAGAIQAAGTIDPDLDEAEQAETFFALLSLLDRLVSEEAADALRDMPGTILGQILGMWERLSQESMGDLGKADSPSSSGRNRAEKRSKSTSRKSAKTSGTSRSTKSEPTPTG